MFGKVGPCAERWRTALRWIYPLGVDDVDAEHCQWIGIPGISTHVWPTSRDPSRVLTRASPNSHGEEVRASLADDPRVSRHNSSSQSRMIESLALNFCANQYWPFSIAFSISLLEIKLGFARPDHFTNLVPSRATWSVYSPSSDHPGSGLINGPLGNRRRAKHGEAQLSGR